MITAMIFDLDGTLVQTEMLKAISYARAAVELRPGDITKEEVIEAFGDLVGRSRREVATGLVERFDLTDAALAIGKKTGVDVAWQAFVQVRLPIYEEMLADPQIIREHRWPRTLALLEDARKAHCRLGLATMSFRPQAQRILDILGLGTTFDVIAARDDVATGKPDPEIYQLVARKLDVPPDQCLVIEDSPAGVTAAIAAGMHVIAVATPFTRRRLHQLDTIDSRWIVDDPVKLPATVVAMYTATSG